MKEFHLEKDVDLRLEHFGSVIFRRKLFDFAELDPFGTLVCEVARGGGARTEDLVEVLSTHYGRPESEVRVDVMEFLSSMEDRGFVRRGEDTSVADIDLQTTIGRLEEAWADLPEMDHYSAPLQFHWEITRECNMRCSHCYATASARLDGASDTLDWEYSLGVLDTLSSMGVVQINFLGGEPTIESRFMELLEETHRRGIDISFPTNGMLLDRATVERLKGLGVEYLTISLDSADPETYQRLRGVEGSHRQVIENIRMARSLGMNIIVNAVVTKLNWREFEPLIDLLVELDVSILKVIDEFPVGRGLQNMEKLMLTPDEYREFYREMMDEVEPRYRDRLEIRLNPRFGLGTERGDVPAGDIDYRCSAGRAQCFATADGDVYPCYLFYGEEAYRVGNLNDDPLDSIWNDPESFRCFRVKTGTIAECAECDLRSVCEGGCRGEAYKFTGDFFAANPYCWNLNTGD